MATSDNAQDSVFDKVAKESDNSTASNHPTHQGQHEQAHAYHHQSKGPQISDNMPEAKGKEELKAKAQEMNDHVSK